MPTLLARASAGDEAAVLARDVYIHRLRGSIAAMAAAMDGLDALVFTGGVGENAPMIRTLATEGLGFLGVKIDADINGEAIPDCEIGSSDGTVHTLVIEAREDLQMVSEVREVLGSPAL
jgi:acetate kinase